MDGILVHIIDKKVEEMIVPYIAEAGCSITLEPTLMYNYTPDDKVFKIDSEEDQMEPVSTHLDFHCNDRAKGADKLAKRIINSIEDSFDSIKSPSRNKESGVRSRRGSNYSIGSRKEFKSPSRKNSKIIPNANLSGGFQPKLPKAIHAS